MVSAVRGQLSGAVTALANSRLTLFCSQSLRFQGKVQLQRMPASSINGAWV